MISATLLPPAVVKEVRAVFGVWLACLAAILVNTLVDDYDILVGTSVIFAFGSIGLGALSIGHEYSHGTLPLLLALPTDRRRLLLIKAAVLTIMLLILGAATWLSLSWFGGSPLRDRWFEPAMIPLGIASGLFIAPWLTMLSRSALAGLVLTATVPALLWLAGDLIGLARHGVLQPRAVASTRFDVLLWGMIAASAIAGTLGWRRFMRLEAMDGRASQIHVPAFVLKTTSVRRSHKRSLWLLLGKELRLQQLAFVVAGIYVLVWLALVIARQYGAAIDDHTLEVPTYFYLAIVSVLVGALSSAEERQAGTHEWHLLLPIAPWKQWAVKAGTALCLAIILGTVLPGSLIYIESASFAQSIFPPAIVIAPIFLTACGLFVSSHCRSGIAALLVAVPAILSGLLISNTVYFQTMRLVWRWLSQARDGMWFMPSVSHRFGYEVAIAFSGLLVWLAFRSHRFAERGAALVWRQIGVMVAFLGVTLAVIVIAMYP